MKTKVLLYLMALLYFSAGLVHFLNPDFYLRVMPSWMPLKSTLIYLSGLIEIVLAVLLIMDSTRKVAAWLIIAMLVVYLLMIHIPMSIDFYKSGNKYFLASIARLLGQFVLLFWAAIYTKDN
ncbi:DoxX family protein [Pedobacter nutrimenti]|uniref:Putative membrane protein n=1 Tax=Pedobacter nutrimenti TaxID=1241337 RepID=A0A318UKZ7_9SPHI|nr:MauE/DoxX family redox-associated membrane protein [Pedobacter nutrimenti]PYF77062.1 putative membrane protein [Pedobacter nutrimenti]